MNQESRTKLSLCMIVRDEEVMLGDALSSARPHCCEMIVVDTGSRDRTRDIAKEYGAVVHDFVWRDDFATARNFSLSLASGEWILVLDADERLLGDGWSAILTAIAENRHDSFDLRQINYSRAKSVYGFEANRLNAPGFAEYPGYTISWLTRLLRNGAGFSFDGIIHEHLARNGVIADGARLNADIHHHGQAIIGDKRVAKKAYYAMLGERKARDRPQDAKAWQEAGIAHWENGDLTAAERCLSASATLFPRDAKTIIGLATVMKLVGKYAEAEAVLRTWLKVAPADTHAHGALGGCLAAQGRHDEAILAYCEQVLANPDFPVGRQWLYQGHNLARQADASRRATLSVCYIVKNEADCLGKSIANVKEHTDDIVVLDTGSTDATREIAVAMGARVYHAEWRDDFSLARNESLKYALGEWVLVLDADEVLGDDDWKKLSALIAKPASEMYFLVQTTYSNVSTVLDWIPNNLAGDTAKGYAGYFESALVRLIRNNPAIRFTGSVHEHAHHDDKRVTALPTDIRIHHYGKFRADAKMSEKYEMYRRIGDRKLMEMPAEPHAWYEMALQLMELNRMEEAEPYFIKTLELNPRYKKAMLAYAGYLTARKRYPEALDWFMKLLALEPADYQVYQFMSSLLIELKKFDLALQMIHTARRLGGEKSVALMMNEAVIYMAMNDLEHAEKILSKALAVNSAFAPVIINMGVLRSRQGRITDAEQLFLQAATLAPADMDAWRKLAEARFRMGKRAEALEDFVRAHARAPLDPHVMSQIILTARALGRADTADEFLQRLSRLPDDGDKFAALARIREVEAYASHGESSRDPTVAVTADNTSAERGAV